MAKKKATLKVSEKFNLNELFGTEFPDDRRLRLKVGNEIVQAIKQNTQSGLDKKGRSFKKYSDSYKKSFPFKVFGKSGSVDLTLTGDMLDTMEVIEDDSESVTVGWQDEQQKLKAENHIHGVTLPKRDFLGLPDAILNKIVEKNRALVERAADDRLTKRDEDRLDREAKAEGGE